MRCFTTLGPSTTASCPVPPPQWAAAPPHPSFGSVFHRLSPLLSDPLNPSVPDQGLAECRLCLGSGSPGLIPDDMGDGSYLGDPPLPSLAHPARGGPQSVAPGSPPHLDICVTDALTSLRLWRHLRCYLRGSGPRLI